MEEEQLIKTFRKICHTKLYQLLFNASLCTLSTVLYCTVWIKFGYNSDELLIIIEELNIKKMIQMPI